MTRKTDFVVRAFAGILEPRETVIVSRQAGDDVVVAVTIDIVSKHVRRRSREFVFMEHPVFVGYDFCGLFEPAIASQHVHTSVAVDIADSQTMTKRPGGGRVADAVEGPGFQRLASGRKVVAVMPVSRADQFGNSIARDVGELWSFIADLIRYGVFFPERIQVVSTGIAIHVAGRAGKTSRQNVAVAITIEVINPVKEVIRIALHVLGHCRINLMLLFKRRASIPVRAVNRIAVPVAVDVSRPGAFRKIDVGQLNPLEFL